MLLDVRQVFVIQCKSTGHFLSEELYMVRGLKDAGRCDDLPSAVDTAIINFEQDYEIFSFFEKPRR